MPLTSDRLQHLVHVAMVNNYHLRPATCPGAHGLDSAPEMLPSTLAFVKPESPARVLVHVNVEFIGGSTGGGGGGGSTAASDRSRIKRNSTGCPHDRHEVCNPHTLHQ